MTLQFFFAKVCLHVRSAASTVDQLILLWRAALIHWCKAYMYGEAGCTCCGAIEYGLAAWCLVRYRSIIHGEGVVCSSLQLSRPLAAVATYMSCILQYIYQ